MNCALDNEKISPAFDNRPERPYPYLHEQNMIKELKETQIDILKSYSLRIAMLKANHFMVNF
jgi:hypothetical protein